MRLGDIVILTRARHLARDRHPEATFFEAGAVFEYVGTSSAWLMMLLRPLDSPAKYWVQKTHLRKLSALEALALTMRGGGNEDR